MLPDSSPGKQRRNCWLRVGTVTKYVVVRSKVGWFRGHWSRQIGRSIRCAGDGCTICATGVQARVFTYVMVEDQNGEVLVWEIPERLFALAQELEASLFNGPGCVLGIVREGTAKNSRLNAFITDQQDTEELDIWAFVDTLGGTLDNASSSSLKESALSKAATAVP
jgi:hypothetical protein